jgi:hypothetical protein
VVYNWYISHAKLQSFEKALACLVLALLSGALSRLVSGVSKDTENLNNVIITTTASLIYDFVQIHYIQQGAL